MSSPDSHPSRDSKELGQSSFSPLNSLIRFCLQNRLVVILGTLLLIFWGLIVTPFDWDISWLERDPVPVDAIPDIGENQQIVFTDWPGRSPKNVEDQITYPLTSALLGLPEVKSIRSSSMFGFSMIFVVFHDRADFYWSRSRILEKLNSLPSGTLPNGVQPSLGPDATALGQVFWYTLEGRNPARADTDPLGEVTGGWDLQELRTIQDWYVRQSLQAVEGVAEVASIGGYVKEYQIDIDPDALRNYGVTLEQVYEAVRDSNEESGARTIELNRVEYMVRGIGFLKGIQDLEQTVVRVHDGTPVTLNQLAVIQTGPAYRQGVLDKDGSETVGGVVVTRYGENPMAVIQRVKDKILEIAPGLPEKILSDGSTSKVTVVPFYDRTGLILETLETLEEAIVLQVLVTVIVVVILILNLRSSIIISSVMPLAVLFSFICMKLFGIDANIVALSGIAIAIGTIVDIGIVLCENTLEHLEKSDPSESRIKVVYRACTEVGSAVLTAVATTLVSFLPVFAMEGAEGKLFIPLAYTKTFALIGSIVVSLTLVPVMAYLFLRRPKRSKRRNQIRLTTCLIVAALMTLLLALAWHPMGPGRPIPNILFAFLSVGLLTGIFIALIHFYGPVLRWLLDYKFVFIGTAGIILLWGALSWLGLGKVFFFVPESLRTNAVWRTAYHTFPGLGKEFMPSLDEGAFLFMPTTMPHASLAEASEILSLQDAAIRTIPEVESVVGKIGRVESALDPAPISMVETVITYKPEYTHDSNGRLVRQWRDEIRTPDDIWADIIRVSQVPGVTSAPKLQPIEARQVMLQSGLRAAMGIKVFGPDLDSIEQTALRIEALLKEVPALEPATVFADRIVGKPYLEIIPNREALARYGISMASFQHTLNLAVGGEPITSTVEGRERYPVRIRYQRELRDSWESLEKVLVSGMEGAQIPLVQVANIQYARGPDMIRSENTFLVGFVIFDRKTGIAEIDAVEQARDHLSHALATQRLQLPDGVNYQFTGTYENQVRAEAKLTVILPVSLVLIFLILYLQFKRLSLSLLVFSDIALAWAGGFILIWLYAQPWFMDIHWFGTSIRELFQMHPIHLSVAVWVGFLALFGIATDDGVLMGTYLREQFENLTPRSREEIRDNVVAGALRRIRPASMTTVTTVLALLPALTSTGRGADIMVPMAIPVFGGMLVSGLTVYLVPVFFCAVEEWRLKRRQNS